MLNKEFLKAINPKQQPYNPKYSEGTYKFLHKNKNKDIKIHWRKRNNFSGDIVAFDPSKIKFYSTQVCFMYKENGNWFGTSWANIMRNEHKLYDYSDWDREEFEDITEWFCDEYLRIGRCLFDSVHTNFLLGENHNYVNDSERFEIVDGIKYCRWCGKEVC